MDDYGASTYGDRVADVYDEMVLGMGLDTEGTVEFLAERAGQGPALELAIGTGRIALPLSERGIEIHGIDASEAMVARLRGKPGGADIPVTIGDFADVGVDGRYRLIFVVFNTLWALLSQEDQTRCVRNAAERLAPDGAFVIETFVPDPARFDRGQRFSTRTVASRRVVLEAATHDPAGQRVSAQQIVLEEGGGIRMYPVEIRYVALGAGPHGSARGPTAPRALGRLAPRAVHRRGPARLGVRARPVTLLLEHRQAARATQAAAALHRPTAPSAGTRLGA